MTRLSSRRKESSTAFFSHWWVIHCPPDFSATRNLPESSAASTALTASRSGLVALSVARVSQASSMIFFCLSIFSTALQPLRRLDAFLDRGDERHADVVPAGIAAGRVAREKTAGQHENIIFTVQSPGEVGVVTGRLQPQVEAAVRFLGLQNGNDRIEFLCIEATVLDDMLLVAPGRDGSLLDSEAHRRAVVGAVEEKLLDQRRVAAGEARAHPGAVGALGKAGEGDDALIASAELMAGLPGNEGGAVEVDLGIALVRSDGEAVPV